MARAPKLRGHAGSTSHGHARSDPVACRRLELRCCHDLEHEAGERTARGDGEVDRGALLGENETLRPGDRPGRPRSTGRHGADRESERGEERGGLVGCLPDQRRHRHERPRQLALVAGEVGLPEAEDAWVADGPGTDACSGVVDAIVARVRRAGEHGHEVVGAAVVGARLPTQCQAVRTEEAADILRRFRRRQIAEEREQREVPGQDVEPAGVRPETVVPTGRQRSGRGNSEQDAPAAVLERRRDEALLGGAHQDAHGLAELMDRGPRKRPVCGHVEPLGPGAEAVRQAARWRDGRDAKDDPVAARAGPGARRHRRGGEAVRRFNGRPG